MLDNEINQSISDNEQDMPETAQESKLTAKNFYDNEYIKAYCNNPKAGKSEALRQAGYTGQFLAQDAYRLHNRLRDKIRETMDKLILDGGDIGYSVLVELCKESDSDSVKVTAAKNLMDYAGRKPGDTLTIKKEQTIDDLDTEIEQLLKEQADQEGKELH